jgi:RHS repeat-associated protein
MKYFLTFFAVVLVVSCTCSNLLAQGEENPTGVAGIYNGNVTTGGCYDPHSGNAMRTVTDIVVPGCVGAYPLKWTRYANSRRMGATWTFPFNYQIGSYYYFPDGREISTIDNGDIPAPTGIEEFLGIWNGKNAIFLGDGGKVVFDNVNGTNLVSQIVDPYGQAITFTRDSYSKVTRMTEPGGRYLQINWHDPNSNGVYNYVTSVQAFDGIPGHITPIDSVTYTWGSFNLGGGVMTTVLYTATYGDGTSAAYTYIGRADSNTPGSPKRAVLLTADDVRVATPMRQISYSVGLKGKLDSEANKVTGEIVSSMTSSGTSGAASETRGDNATRNFHYASKYEMDPALVGKLFDYTDFLGHTTTLEYEMNPDSPTVGFIKKVTDANNHSTSYTRQDNSWGIKTIKHDVDNSTIQQTFWAEDGGPNPSETSPHYLKSRTDELGHTTTYTRDSNYRITQKDYPASNPVPALDPSPAPIYETFDYSNNLFGLVGSHRLTNGQTESFIYDSRGLKTSSTNGAGEVTTYTYYSYGDANWPAWADRLKTVTKQANISGGTQTETYEYDKSFDVNGVETTTSCSGRGLVTKITHTDGTTVKYTHNKWGDVLTVTDELNHVITTNTYDEYGRVLTTATAPRFQGDTMNHTATFSYIPWGFSSSRITTSKTPFVVTPPSGAAKATNTYYDANWRKTRVQQAPNTADEANSYLYYDSYAGYTSIGNLLASKDPRNYVTKYHYDNRDRQDQTSDALAASLGDPLHSTFFTYDYHGNKLTETHPKPDAATNPEVITFIYDNLNRLKTKTTKRTDTITDTVNMAYDPGSNLWKFQDEDAVARSDATNIYVYTYDGVNRKRRTTYPNGLYEEALYDSAGNMKTYQNRNTNLQSFTYDNRNRGTGFSWNDGITPSQSMVPDAASRVQQLSNSISTINYTYFDDNLLKTQEEWTSQFSDNVHRTMTYDYNADNNRLSVQYPSGTAFNYTYTNRNQVDKIQPGLSGGTFIIDYGYDVNGNITSAIRDNGTSSAFTVDTVNRETAAVHTLAGPTIRRFDYAYNNVHDITVVQRDSGLGDGYHYDLTQQIDIFWQNGTVNLSAGTIANPATTNSMIFDGCGNRTSLNSVPQTFDNMNQPTGVTFSHDSKGNLCTNGGSSYTYDAQNRLTRAVVAGKSGNTTVDFYYDAKNRQIARSINNGTTTITFSVWDDWELVEEYTNGNIRTAAYVQGAHGPIKSLLDNKYYYQDSLGSTSHIASSTGSLLEYYKYDLNGKPTYWDANGNPLPNGSNHNIRDLFAGERWIPEIGLYDDRNRFYDPALGRFLQPDPIGFKGDASNLYRYCGNDWANKADPMGLDIPGWDHGQVIKCSSLGGDEIGQQDKESQLMAKLDAKTAATADASKAEPSEKNWPEGSPNKDPHPKFLKPKEDKDGYVQIDAGQKAAFEKAKRIADAKTDSREAIVGVVFDTKTQTYSVTPTFIYAKQGQHGSQHGLLPKLPAGPADRYGYAGQVHGHTNGEYHTGDDLHFGNDNRTPIGVTVNGVGKLYIPRFNARSSEQMQGKLEPFGD